MTAKPILPIQKFETTSRSEILRGEKPTKGMDATLAANEHQTNRLIAYLADGTKVLVAQRPGNRGMDFNKLLGAHVLAVSADAFAPVFEKGEDKKKTNVQKVEDGLPLYSTSGFYLLSSKDYPGVKMFEAYTHLLPKGEKALILTEEQIANKQLIRLESDLDLDLLVDGLTAALSDARSCVTEFDAFTNRKRRAAIETGKSTAELNDETYDGTEFKELSASKKDGNPFVLYAWRAEGGELRSGTILREFSGVDAEGRERTQHFDVETTLQRFIESEDGKALMAALAAFTPVDFSMAQGNLMRTSKQFRGKVEKLLAVPRAEKVYGDAVYIWGALDGWKKAHAVYMHSMHPKFPATDYDAHHYVTALRQAEVGMNRAGGGWTTPLPVLYDLPAALLN